jgi:DNA-binding response OmpR family regulator
MHDMIIAALTGYGQESDRRRSLEAGFDYHFTKPADLRLLESLVTLTTLRHPSSLRQAEQN